MQPGTFSFNYVSAAGINGLFMAALVFDVSTGVAVYLDTVAMASIGLGAYWGQHAIPLGKTYMVIMVAFTDGTFAVPRPNTAAGTTFVQAPDKVVSFIAWDYTAYDQNAALYVKGLLYAAGALSGGGPMAHVAYGAYLGTSAIASGQALDAVSMVYSDPGYTMPAPFRAAAGASFQGGVLATTIANTFTTPILEGQSVEAELAGQATLGILEASCQC